jgi:hypothetical protein
MNVLLFTEALLPRGQVIPCIELKNASTTSPATATKGMIAHLSTPALLGKGPRSFLSRQE